MPARAAPLTPNPMATTFAAVLLAALLLPLLILLWASESREQRIRRWRRAGASQQLIADRIGCSRSTVRRVLAAGY